MTVWHFEFFRVGDDGKRIGGDAMTDGSTSLEEATAKAKSIMRSVTLPLSGEATLCVVKRQDGTVVREVRADADRS